jgi:hypothetical protein
LAAAVLLTVPPLLATPLLRSGRMRGLRQRYPRHQ